MNNRNKKKVQKEKKRKLIKNNKAIVIVPGCVDNEDGMRETLCSGWV